MAETYTIKAVGDPREWSSEKWGGRFYSYPLTLEGIDETVEWSRKVDSQAPRPGERIVADISKGPHGLKLKLDYDATKELDGGGASPAGSRNSGGREWTPEGERDPEKVARIGRAAAQKVAAEIACVAGYFKGEVTDGIFQNFTQLVDRLEADVNAAAKAARGVGTTGTQSGGAPANPGPGPAQTAPEDDIPFARPEYPALFSERERWSNRP